MPSAVTETEFYEASVIGPVDGDPRNAASVRAGFEDLANRTQWLQKRLSEVIGTPQPITSVNASTDVITLTGHGYNNADAVRLTSVGGNVPGGLAVGTVYYVRDKTADTFKLAATSGGSVIDITSTGSGALYVWTVPDSALWFFLLFAGDNLWTGGNAFDKEVEFNNTTKAATFHGPVEVEDLLAAEGRYALGGQADTTTIAGTGDVTVSVATARVFYAATPTANRKITLSLTSPVPEEGEVIEIIRPATGAFTYEVWKAGGAAAMATLAASTFCGARFRIAGSTWRLLAPGTGVTPGAEA